MNVDTGHATSAGGAAPVPQLSVVAPAHNEAPNLEELCLRVQRALGGLSFEFLVVDDGSTDDSQSILRRLGEQHAEIRPVFLQRRHGQSAALCAGFARARAPLIATLDADLQNDPLDLIVLLDALGSHDAAVGFRMGRQDSPWKRLCSRVGALARRLVIGDRTQDTGCGLKLFRTEALQAIPMFHGVHRFFPVLLRQHGFQVVECPVRHHPRTKGQSKYGVWNRLPRTLMDLLAVRWMSSRVIRTRPAAEPDEPRS